MDMAIGIGIIGAITVAVFVVLYKVADNKYPPVMIDVYDRGMRQRIKYRLFGKTVVADNLFQILLNRIDICGNLNELEFDATPVGFGRWGRVYRAVRRHDYLFALKKEKTVTVSDGTSVRELDISQTPPVIVFEKTDENNHPVIGFSKDGWLTNMHIENVKEPLCEKEITNGKQICQRFIEMQKSNKEFVDSTNPVIAMLLYSVPLLLIVISIGIVLFLVVGEVSDMLTRVSENIATIAK